MDKPKITAKDFFLWAGAMVAFYWSVIAFIFLLFNYIDYTFPNALMYYPADPYASGISYQMASVIVLLPLFMFLMRFIRRDMALDPSRKEIWVRRWALILTLFAAGIAIAADLITLLTTFLNGEELTTAFLLKVLVVLLVAAGAFMHFSADLKGYWETFPMRKRYVGIGVSALALVAIISGFFIVGTPADARLARFDAQKVSDLEGIQSAVVNYWQAKQKLPAAITDLTSPLISYAPILVDEQTGQPYVYRPKGVLSFELCATFNAVSRGSSAPRRLNDPSIGPSFYTDNWQHGAGEVCFDRTIDPSFYPPLSKVQP